MTFSRSSVGFNQAQPLFRCRLWLDASLPIRVSLVNSAHAHSRTQESMARFILSPISRLSSNRKKRERNESSKKNRNIDLFIYKVREWERWKHLFVVDDDIVVAFRRSRAHIRLINRYSYTNCKSPLFSSLSISLFLSFSCFVPALLLLLLLASLALFSLFFSWKERVLKTSWIIHRLRARRKRQAALSSTFSRYLSRYVCKRGSAELLFAQRLLIIDSRADKCRHPSQIENSTQTQ